jgi:amino acid adenylation domain-containing protein
MSDDRRRNLNLPPGQEAIRAKCFHPSGTFIEFTKEEIEQSIPERFEKIVPKYRDRVAVKTSNQTLTYEELNRLANRVADAILAESRDNQRPVALLLDNDAPMIAAILGVLKAGKIYVPLDPLLPDTRAGYIMDDSKAGLIVTNGRNRLLANKLARNTLPLFDLDSLDASLPSGSPSRSVSPDTPAWIIYTSGSTGRPKGVVQNHRNVLHFVMNYTNGLHLCAEDRLTVLSSFSVNAANHDIFTALLNGASLYPLNIKECGVGRLIDWLILHEITIYHSVPSVFRHFLDPLIHDVKFSSVRVIRFGGESTSKRDVELYKRHFSRQSILVNRLGSTETGTLRWYFMDQSSRIEGNIVPVGYPVEDNEILVLDESGKEVEIGGTGEIAVKSRYVSPGYWRKPDLTKASFLPGSEGGAERTYRTGDVGRLLPDGCLIHLGRKDFQVKIRGHRIEIAEIEMALLDHPAIKQAIVIPREDYADDQRLAAYLVAATRPAPAVSELRGFLKATLPDYMVPSTWIFLEAFPLAPNGKVDRQGLPPPSSTRPELAAAFVAARTPIEARLAEIWSEVLSIDQVGVTDNFLDLGGHSLAATRVISQVIKHFQVDLPLKSLFELPTVAEMARLITEHQAKKLSEHELQSILKDLESMSDERAQRFLSELGETKHESRDG